MPTAEELARNPRLKIERAKHHIRDLNRQINTYLAEKPFKLVRTGNADTREVALRTKTNKAIPAEFALILGDIAHNLRSALDLTIFTLVGGRSPSPWKVQFPFCRKPEGMDSAINNGQVRFAGEKVVDAVCALRPYNGGNKILWDLQALDSSDKHRLPIFAWRTAQMSATALGLLGLPTYGPGVLHFYGESDKIAVFPDPILIGPNGPTRLTMDFEQDAQFQPAYSICFRQGDPFEGQLIVDAMMKTTTEVEHAVTKLVCAFLSEV